MQAMSDRDYFSARSRQERLAAEASSDPNIAAVHSKMADLYDAAAERAGVQSPMESQLLRPIGQPG